MSAPILPGATIGVLGGGQLGRMFTLAARRMGYWVNVLAPEDGSPAGQVAYRETRAPYDDLDAVARFAGEVDVVTFEFENIPAAAAEAAARHAPVRPAGSLLTTTQNRIREKRALEDRGFPVAPFAVIEAPEQAARAGERIGYPAVLKTAAWGYDGKGQQRVDGPASLARAVGDLGRAPCVLERFVPFAAELSVVGARTASGEIALYDPTLNRHRDHILDVSLAPAPVAVEVRERARELARAALEAFEVVGVLCVEMFVLEDGSLLVNELAPRPHNSGHLTVDAYTCSQFEQQVRAVCGLPLGEVRRVVPAVAMVNLLGDLWDAHEPDWAAALADPGVRLHLYGKVDPRPGRKMGHLCVASESVEDAERRALAARAAAASRKEEAPWICS